MKFKNILLIDDDEDDHEIFVTALEQISSAINYWCFTDARKAFQQLITGKITPEVIFLDLNMPLMSGEEFLRLLKLETIFLTVPVIIFTTSSDASIRKEMLAIGAHDFLTKPSDYKDLVALLEPKIG